MYEPIKYTELLRRNTELARRGAAPLDIAVLSNVTITSIKEVLEYSLRSRGIDANVQIGEYDNIAQDSERFHDSDAIVVFYELAAIVDNLPFALHRYDEAGIQSLVSKAQQELGFIFDVLADAKLVLLNLLTALPFTVASPREQALDRICREVNAFIRANAPRSFRLIETEKVMARCGVQAAIDLRFFLSSRALYQFAFLRAYSELVYPLIGLRAGHYKKVLVLDCDNTLWKGILGEDGLEGIQFFEEIHSMVARLAQSGVLVCLCSKNNPEDVEAALAHSGMLLKDEHLVVKAVNWRDKADNIAQIAETLNVGLDSFVFVDDSDFELHVVREKLPAVTTFKVPDSYPEYLWRFQDIASLFYRETSTTEDLTKTQQYRTEFARQEQRARFGSVEEYLESLELVVTLAIDSVALAPRLAQLTQKTNQFNLTTRRMTEAEVTAAIQSPADLVIGIDVRDKYGAYGTTGFILVRQQGEFAEIESFLLSCRVLGRGVERRTFDAVVAMLRARGVRRVRGSYLPTAKNAQVRDLYSTLGFRLAAENDSSRHFELDLNSYEESGIGYIRLENS